MSDWPSFTVAELQAEGSLLVEDGNHGEYRPRPHEFVDVGTAFIRATDLSGGEVSFDSAGRIDLAALTRIRKGLGRPGDVLFSHKGTVGKLARVPMNAPDFVCSPQTTFWRVLDENRLRRDYLYAFMRSRAFIDQWWARKGETDMADYVSLTAQRQLRVSVPPIQVQARIAEPLAAMDDLIETNRRRIGLLERMAQAIYREWFVRFRYPGHEDIALVPSPLGFIPDGWAWRTVAAESVVLARGIAPKYADDGDSTVLNQKCIRNNRVSLRLARRQSRAVPEDKHVQFGDVLVNSTGVGTLGRVAVFLERHRALTADSHVTIVRPRETTANPWFGLSLINHQATFEALGTGSTGQTELSSHDIGAVQLARPPLDVQRSFAEIAWPLLGPISSFTAWNERLGVIRDLLLPKLVTGQIDVSDLDLDAVVESVA
ncbi:MAG: restriction endonuclease subunit S [Acidimicrobiales bacterium]